MNKLSAIFFSLTIAVFTFTLFNYTDIDYKTNFPFQRSEFGTKENPQARAEFEFQMVRNPKTGKVPNEIRPKEIEFVKTLPSRKINIMNKTAEIKALDFQSRGPINRGGRTRALGVDIRSTAGNVTIIAAGVSGGIWKSTDNGASWKQTSLPSQINNATCIVQDIRTGHENTWYIGTGEARGNSASGGNAFYLGDGIFKSVDNGESWVRIPSTVRNTPQTYNQPFNFVHALAINPTTGTLFAAASNVILRSTNGGDSWTIVRGSLANSSPTYVTVSSNGSIFAAINSSVTDKGVWKSTNDGLNWSNITPSSFPQVYNKMIVAIAPSDPNRIYLIAHTPGTGAASPSGTGDEHRLWVSNDGGSSWIEKTNNLPNADKVAGYASQNGYDMVMAVRPNDPNYVIIGGTNLYRSTDGFATKLVNTKTNWIGGYALANDISQYTNHHADQHALVFAPFNSNIVYSGNDGGVQVCRDLSQPTIVWNQLNKGYQTSQFYSIAVDHASSDDVLLGGLQDNAHYFTSSNDPNSPWKEMVFGGDGGFTAIANYKSSYYIEPQNGFLIRLRLNDSGVLENWTVAKPNHNTNYLFINPYTLDPNNTNRMYFVAGDSLWRNNDLTAIPNFQQDPTSINWDLLSNTATGDKITAVSVSKNPANIVYYGSSNGRIFKLINAHTGNPTPIDISTGKGMPNGYVSSLAVDKANANNVIVVFSNYAIISLYYTNDGGSSWSAISGNLEQNSDGSGNGPSCRWASILNFNGTKTYFVATSAGLYSTNLLNGNATTWVREAPNKIGVSVCTMIKTRDLDGLVVVATHGAGVFSADFTVDVKDDSNKPENFKLYQNYPNPFNPSTTIKYSVPTPPQPSLSQVEGWGGVVSLKIYDILGREVVTLVNEQQQPGNYEVNFTANKLPSGTYFYRLTFGNFSATKKFILLK